jgi:ABC-2 type transport system permease protein/lipopolysaccharide transport system permease protein
MAGAQAPQSDSLKIVPDRVAGTAMKFYSLARILAAIRDLRDGLSQSELWLTLGWHDIRQRYRRSIAGPFWITISMAMLIAGLGYMSSGILNQRGDDALPYISAGIIVFYFISALINEGCNVFIETSRSILQIKSPFSIYVYQVVWRNLLIFLHNITIYAAVAIIYRINPGYTVLLAVPGLLAILINGFFLGFLLGGLGARFRDVPLICTNLMQVAFFLSPVFWRATQAQHPLFFQLNPFYYFLESVRMPLMGQAPPSTMWIVIAMITCANAIVSILFFARVRARIPYWL